MIKKALIALLYIAVWQALAMARGNEYLLSSPVFTFQSLVALMGEGRFYASVSLSLARVAGGFVLGAVLGTLLGLLTGFSKTAAELLRPFLGLLKATPVASFIILVLLWLSNGIAPLFAIFVVVTPLIWASVDAGVRSADKELLEMARLFKLSAGKRLLHIYLPSLLPQYLAACTTALGFAWKAGVAAEVIAHPALSIGQGIYASKINIETPELFAWTLVTILLSMAFEKLVTALLGRIRT
ncbi:MAG: ABC transporter permease subunit [Clostridiaceae bacterium]|nr:ABC transporter permease subunit [Eubacteriales bacterium]